MNHLRLDRHGWLIPTQQVRKVASPNFNDRPPHHVARLLVIHNISLPPFVFGGPYIEQLFTNRLEVNHHPFLKRLRT